MSRIFISHTNGDRLSDALLPQLIKELSRKGCPAFVDKKDIKTGDDWRQRIIVSLHRCDGAVLLVSDAALAPGKFWVAREAQLLLARRMLAQGSNTPKLVIVLLGGLSLSTLEGDDRFRDLGISDLQILERSFDPADVRAIDSIVTEIAGEFGGPSTADSEIDRLAATLAEQAYLPFDQPLLESALIGAGLKLEADPWGAKLDLRPAFVLRLLEAEAPQLRKAIAALTRAQPERSLFYKAFAKTLVASTVNPAQAAAIADEIKVFHTGGHCRMLVLNSAMRRSVTCTSGEPGATLGRRLCLSRLTMALRPEWDTTTSSTPLRSTFGTATFDRKGICSALRPTNSFCRRCAKSCGRKETMRMFPSSISADFAMRTRGRSLRGRSPTRCFSPAAAQPCLMPSCAQQSIIVYSSQPLRPSKTKR